MTAALKSAAEAAAASPTVADIRAAQQRIAAYVQCTPLLESPLLNARLGCRLLVKAECLQPAGAFKVRGAFNNILQLTPDEKKKGVVAFSSGNHAQAVAYAAQCFNIPAVIVMPRTAPQLKIANTRAYGAEVVLYDIETESREAIGEELSRTRGLSLVLPYDSERTITGQGTAGLEIADQCKERSLTPDHVIIPCSGGGLAAGVGIAMKAAFPTIAVHTAEPEGFDDMMRSLVSGTFEKNVRKSGSICDALLSETPGTLTLPLLQHLGATGYKVSDQDALQAMATAAAFLKLALEPGGATALATVLRNPTVFKGRTVVVVASGGNTDPETLEKALKLPA